jgi:hypothetical protein
MAEAAVGRRSWLTERNLLFLVIAGWLIFGVAFVVTNPLGPGLGVSGSAPRLVLLWVYAVVAALPWAIFWIYKFAQHPEWLAPPGRYVPGMRVQLFSPYTYVAIGAVGALFAVAGLFDIAKLDFQAMVIAASAALYGAPVSFFGLLVGQIIARGILNPVWLGGGAATLGSLIPYSLFDASIWAYAGYIYFRVVHSRPANRPFVVAFIVAWILSEPIHQLFWFISYAIMNPWEAFVTSVTADWVLPLGALPAPYWVLSALLFVPVGYLAGESIRRGMRRRFQGVSEA